MQVVTRSYNAARSGANLNETVLTPRKIGANLLVKKVSLHFAGDPHVKDDPRLEAQPRYLPAIKMSDGKVHAVVYVCAMATNVWVFDQYDGKPSWVSPTH